jgi:hypothetical protein
MSTLLIWEDGEEGPELFEASGEVEKLVLRCQNKYINTLNDNEDIVKLYSLFWPGELGVKADLKTLEPDLKKINFETDSCGPFNAVILCGWMP